MIRFLFFILIFAIVFAFIGKWIYVYVKHLQNKEKAAFNKFSKKLDVETEMLINRNVRKTK